MSCYCVGLLSFLIKSLRYHCDILSLRRVCVIAVSSRYCVIASLRHCIVALSLVIGHCVVALSLRRSLRHFLLALSLRHCGVIASFCHCGIMSCRHLIALFCQCVNAVSSRHCAGIEALCCHCGECVLYAVFFSCLQPWYAFYPVFNH